MIFQNGWFPVGVVMAAWPVLLVILLYAQAGMGVGIAASFRIFVGCCVSAGLEFECLSGSGQLAA